ncbi:MAG: hypothetical protein Q9220_002286 [cf. Caloplaca sp. 1 TL-2023]
MVSGPTKPHITARSEGESYLALARANTYFSLPPPSPTHNITHDPHSTESYQNLLFSLLVFRRHTSRYPTHITLISHLFKKRRYKDLHLRAIRWPPERVTYVGINPPDDVSPTRKLEEDERVKGYGAWEGDLYGCGEYVRGVRERRGWREEKMGEVIEGLEGEEREMVDAFLGWRGGVDGREVSEGRLPWTRQWEEK